MELGIRQFHKTHTILLISLSKIALASIVLSLFTFSLASASESPSYVDGSKPFFTIKDVNRQAEVWAICAASYDVIAGLLGSQTAQSQQMSNLANGAELAVGMALVMNDLDPDISPERFKALWAFSKVAMEEWPKVQLTMILASAEAFGAEGAGEFAEKVFATVQICMKNLETQQMYIDSWRELAKSGLLKFPEN